jgi:hypothetical protein
MRELARKQESIPLHKPTTTARKDYNSTNPYKLIQTSKVEA